MIVVDTSKLLCSKQNEAHDLVCTQASCWMLRHFGRALTCAGIGALAATYMICCVKETLVRAGARGPYERVAEEDKEEQVSFTTHIWTVNTHSYSASQFCKSARC